jgi:MFS family permease
MLVYVLLYAAFGLQSPFLPALLHERGLPAGELSVVLAASNANRVVTGPAIAQSADRLQRHTFILCACALLAAPGLGCVLLESFLPLLTVMAIPGGRRGVARFAMTLVGGALSVGLSIARVRWTTQRRGR